MSLQTLLGSISVIVEKFFSGGDISFCDQDETRSSLEHDRLRLEVRRQPRVIDQTSETAALFGSVDAEIGINFKLLFYKKISRMSMSRGTILVLLDFDF